MPLIAPPSTLRVSFPLSRLRRPLLPRVMLRPATLHSSLAHFRWLVAKKQANTRRHCLLVAGRVIKQNLKTHTPKQTPEVYCEGILVQLACLRRPDEARPVTRDLPEDMPWSCHAVARSSIFSDSGGQDYSELRSKAGMADVGEGGRRGMLRAVEPRIMATQRSIITDSCRCGLDC